MPHAGNRFAEAVSYWVRAVDLMNAATLAFKATSPDSIVYIM